MAEPSPPSSDRLSSLDSDTWAKLLVHVRAALWALGDTDLTPELERMRAAPTSRLAGGRLHRRLVALLARGGPLWRETAASASSDVHLLRVLRGEAQPAARPSATRPAVAPDTRDDAKLRTRIKDLTEQRDEARRQARGAGARIDQLEARVAGLERALAEASSRAEGLADQLAAAAEQREQAVARIRRQGESELAQLRAELRDLRRSQQRHEEAARRREGARPAAPATRRREGPPDRRAAGAAGGLARPGRPSQLPSGAVAGTTEHALALLTPGRLVLVDGYNVTRQHRGHVPLSDQRLWLVRLLEQVATRFRVRPRIVFDSDNGPEPLVGVRSRVVQVSFSQAGLTADDEIAFAVAALPEAEPVLVVTDDRELVDRVREYQADVVGTVPFLSAVR